MKIQAIDSHTAGEPTRVVVNGGPDLGRGTVEARLQLLRTRHDAFRRAVVQEPRGSDVLVGALVIEPNDATNLAGVIFFNNVGYLGMCGHGTMGLVTTLAYLGRIQPGCYRLETAVGVVTATLHPDGQVSVVNVPSYRRARGVTVEVPNADGLLGPERPVARVVGDVAWGGNWFFLTKHREPPLTRANVEPLTEIAWRIRQAVNAQGFPEVDHVELVGPAVGATAHARNFVLCPGKAYDRSPCGTGTSAKLACLAADGALTPGEPWVQESILGTRFTGSYSSAETGILPTITGRAYVNAECSLILDEQDPFCWGLPEGGAESGER